MQKSPFRMGGGFLCLWRWWGRVLAERAGDHILIPEARIFDSRPISDLILYLSDLRARVGDFVVYADAGTDYVYSTGASVEASGICVVISTISDAGCSRRIRDAL